MDHSSIDLNLVKREPGLDDMYSSDPVIFDGMMGLGEDFNDSFHSSMHHCNDEEMPVDWLSNFFDDPTAVPSCAEQLGYSSSLPEYTTSSLQYHPLVKSHTLGMNGLNLDAIPAFPEECSNESLYCSTPSKPRSPDFDHKPLTPDSETNCGDTDLFGPNSVSSQFDSKSGINPQLSGHMDSTDHDRRLELHSTSSDQDSERQDSESGDRFYYPGLPVQSEYASLRTYRQYSYDSAAHSPTCSTPTTPPHSIEGENDCLSGLSAGDTTPPCSQIPEKQPFYLTEEEKRTLIAEGLPVPSGLPLTKVEERALKKVRRKIKNKISAQESRRKKKEYMETLEKRVDTCANENLELRKKVDTLENANRSLISQLQKLQGLLPSKVSRPSNARSTQTGTCLMVVVMCFAVFLGSWAPLSSKIGMFSSAASSAISGKSAVDYSTPSVRSRVLLSVMDDLDSDEYYEYGPLTPNTKEPAEPFMPPIPSTPVATAANHTQKLVGMETVSSKPQHNETKLVAASAA